MKDQNRNKRKIFVNTFHIVVGSIIEKVFFFLITVFIARYLSVDQYGEYTTALGLATFFSMFANLNLNIPIIRAINKNKTFQNEYFTSSLLIKSILSVIIYLALIITLIFTDYNRNTILLALILGVVRIGSEFINTSYAYYEAHEKFNVTVVLLSAFSSIFLLSTIIIIFLKGNYFDFAIVRLFITLSFLFIIILLLRKIYKIKYNLNSVLDFLKRMLPFASSFALQNISSNCGIVILPLVHGTIYAGIYQNSYLIFASLIFIHKTLSRALLPFLYKYPFKDNKNKFQFAYDFYSKVFGIISFYLCTIFYLYASDILVFLFGNKYLSSVTILKIFALGFPFISVATTIITTIDKQKINTFIDSFTAIFQIFFSIILIYFYKVEGAAAALVISFFVNYTISNCYLIYIKKFKYKETFTNILKLFLFILTIYIIHNLFFPKLYFILSIIINSLIYIILVIIFIFKKDDLRIINEIIRINKT